MLFKSVLINFKFIRFIRKIYIIPFSTLVVTPVDELDTDLAFSQLDLDKLDEKIEEEQEKEKLKV